MVSTHPVLNREELSRLPFRRRPVAQPGTQLVFQNADGQLISPGHPYTAGDLWWRGPRVMYVVDITAHDESFIAQLPCDGDTLHFDAAVRYSWRVSEPATVVRENVTEPAARCQAYLTDRLRSVTRRFAGLKSQAAEEEARAQLSSGSLVVGGGLLISAFQVELSINSEQKTLAKDLEIESLRHQVAMLKEKGRQELEGISQDGELVRHKQRTEHFAALLAAGPAAVAAIIAAEDPQKASEAANFMVALYEKDERLAVEALKVIAEGNQLRIGDLDDAVAAVVDRFKAVVGRTDSRLGAQNVPTALGGPAAMIADQPAPAPRSPVESSETAKGDG
ncbi:hypothetical protein [Micromonospora sp. NPDC049301]|uniref:hypothetical protein n=1 Tax=Micromonospora sp. NPDC049301 TaxID=3155723 RepID=UPI00342CAFA5